VTIVAAERAAEYLGIEVKKTPLAWVEAVEKGLPVARLESFAKRIAPGNAQFKYHIVKKATYARRKEAKPARLSKEESEVLLRIAQVFAFAEEVWGGADNAIAFLSTPHPLLEGQPPLDVALRSEVGARLVEDILGRLAYGSAA